MQWINWKNNKGIEIQIWNEFPYEIFSMIERNILFKIQIKNKMQGVYDEIFPVIKIILDNSVIERYSDVYQEVPDS